MAQNQGQQGGDGRGEVKDPQNDGRLKENGGGQGGQGGQSQQSGDGRGQVKDPENDGRLKQNK